MRPRCVHTQYVLHSQFVDHLVPRAEPTNVQFTMLVRSSHELASKRLVYGHYTGVDMAKVYHAFQTVKTLGHPGFSNIEWPDDCPDTGITQHSHLVSEVVTNDEYDHVPHRQAARIESAFEPIGAMLESALLPSNIELPSLREMLKKSKDDDSGDNDSDSGQ